MARGSGEGFDFSEAPHGGFYSAEEVVQMMQIQRAKKHLRVILLILDKHLINRSKAEAAEAARQLFLAVRGYNKLIEAMIYDEVCALISGLQTALTVTDDQVRGAKMARIEEWHATRPKFILHLPELRQIVFSN